MTRNVLCTSIDSNEMEHRCDILAIAAEQPGSGRLWTFLDTLTAEFRVVRIFAIWNARLRDSLERHGWKAGAVVEDGEVTDTMEWTR